MIFTTCQWSPLFIAYLLGAQSAFAAVREADAKTDHGGGGTDIGSALLEQQSDGEGKAKFGLEKIAVDDKLMTRGNRLKANYNNNRLPVQDDREWLHDENRIIGGDEAKEDFYSFTVALQDSSGFFCGGSLIAKDVVLTAAHCKGPPFDVVIGRHDLNDNDGQVISITRQLPHPDYNEDTTDNDFMLVFLSEPTTQNVDLVKINNDPSVPEVGDRVTVMGWGDTDRRDHVSTTSDVLMEVNVRVVSNSVCEKSSDGYDTYRGAITNNMLCANADLQDSCQGDSGGPLVNTRGGRLEQIGVVSWGIGCASDDFPGVYARLSRAYGWIEGEVCSRSREYAEEAGFECDTRDDADDNSNSSQGFKPNDRPTRKPTRKPRRRRTPAPTRRPTRNSNTSSNDRPSSEDEIYHWFHKGNRHSTGQPESNREDDYDYCYDC